jgi:ArsR family transcriptional regulator
MPKPQTPGLDTLLLGLRAAAEATRLRILGLCAHAELTVSELVEILGQSQPRVSRHLRLLVEAGLLERHQEGNWACYRLSPGAGTGELGRLIVDLMPDDDRVHARDLARLEEVKEAWAVKSAAYFRQHASDWPRIQAMHVDEAEVDAALVQALGTAPVGDLLDIGTGTGHVLQLIGGRAESGIGVDRSIDMLKFARANIWRAGLRNCQVRLADMLRLPFPAASFDTVTLRMVLHFAENPAATIAEAARVLRPGGRLIVIDFAAHDRAELREAHAHRWLGFADEQIAQYIEAAGLSTDMLRRLDGGSLSVRLWPARQPANDARGTAAAHVAG